MPRSTAARAASQPTVPKGTWNKPVLAPVVLVRGGEEFLRERAVAGVQALARERDPATEVVVLDCANYPPGALRVATSPSLFGEAKVVILAGAEGGDAVLDSDIIGYLAAVDPEAVVVVVHGGGQRGKKMLDAVIASGAPVLDCAELKRDVDKAGFVTAELRAARRRAEPAAVTALVEAVGQNLRELAGAVAQLVADTTGTISAAQVDQYYGGRVETTGFAVADAALSGDAAGAVTALRNALATGVDPVPIVAAIAVKVRTLAKVAALRTGSITARELGLPDWQVRAAQRDLRRWDDDGLALAITTLAEADAGIKGAQRDPDYALERAVLTIARAARNP